MKLKNIGWLLASLVVLCATLAVAQPGGQSTKGQAAEERPGITQSPGRLPATDAASQEQKLEALSDIRRQLACYCGCSLTVEDCLRSMRCDESASLSKRVIELAQSGKSKPEILKAMVASYGETILSAPTKEGFNLAAWILPVVMLGIGGFAAVRVIKKWRAQSSEAEAEAAEGTPAAHEQVAGDPYDDRVEDELKLLDK